MIMDADASTRTARSGGRPGAGGRLVRSGLALALTGVALVGLGPGEAQASTSQIHGVNWADQRDNFVNGVLYVSGLSSSDTNASATATANAVVGQLYSTTGANTVRMPINEPTVANYWNTYTGAIDAALTKGNVILAYWAYTGGKPLSTGSFNTMWDRVVDRYKNNPKAYFEVINEPHGMSTTDLNNLYNTWLNRYSTVPRDRVILDGAGLATNVAAVGNDTRLNGTLLAVHDYTFFTTPPLDSENQWARRLSGAVGKFADRTVATEWGAPMGPGSKYDIQWDKVDYSVPSGSWWADYIRGISSQLRSSGMGSVYWPGLRDGDWYSLTSRSGTGTNTRLSVVNPSGITRVRYAWGLADTGSTTVALRNTSNSQYADGLGRTTDGSAVGLGGDTSPATRQWQVENDGDYVRFKNRSTGLYLDGMGRTSGGALGQYALSTSTNQQWSVLTDANNVRIKNRGTGLFVQVSGSGLIQSTDSGSTAQRWKVVAAGPVTTPTTTPPVTTTPVTTTPVTTTPVTTTTSASPAVTTPSASSTSGTGAACQVSFTPNAWSSGFTVDVKVTNRSSSAINGWTLALTLPSGQTLANGWNATFAGSTGTVRATALDYNATIAPGGNAQFGFQGTLTGSYTAPTAPVLNDTACSIG